MTKIVAKVRTIISYEFTCDNPEHAKKIVADKVWAAFDEIEALHNEIELDEIYQIDLT